MVMTGKIASFAHGFNSINLEFANWLMQTYGIQTGDQITTNNDILNCIECDFEDDPAEFVRLCLEKIGELAIYEFIEKYGYILEK